ncbi:MAG: aminoglycoside phosphotransferase family protein [Anditalea sp.]
MDKIGLILEAYDLKDKELEIRKYGSGHIHGTYLLHAGAERFILQAYNKKVFRFPERISGNQNILSEHLGAEKLPFALPLPIKNLDGNFFSVHGHQLFRLFPFVEGLTKDAVELPQEAHLAAEAFGIFIKAFLDVSTEGFQETIPDFHNLTLRYQQLQDSIHNTKLTIDRELQALMEFYIGQTGLLYQYQDYQKKLPLRVTHNDTKINNLIFEENLSKVNALIDLDTIMPGFIFYDFGDLVRTVACSEDESSQNWNSIQVDLDKYKSLITGFCNPLKPTVSKEELASLPYGGEMMTYIMGLRFLTDYLNGNVYYHINYPQQNLHRAKNQFHLLSSLQENRARIGEMMEEVTKDQ